MIDRNIRLWNERWAAMALSERIRWKLKLRPPMCHALQSFHVTSVDHFVYEHYKVLQASYEAGEGPRILVIELFPGPDGVITLWSVEHKGHCESFQRHYHLSEGELQYVQSLFDEMSLMTLITVESLKRS